jgi:Helicase C-terminal domain
MILQGVVSLSSLLDAHVLVWHEGHTLFSPSLSSLLRARVLVRHERYSAFSPTLASLLEAHILGYNEDTLSSLLRGTCACWHEGHTLFSPTLSSLLRARVLVWPERHSAFSPTLSSLLEHIFLAGMKILCLLTYLSSLLKAHVPIPYEAHPGSNKQRLDIKPGRHQQRVDPGRSRCVVVVGLPFPNPSDPELRERMAYLDNRGAAGPPGGSPQEPSPGRQYYEDLCMKAVNQCVGRVIRHRSDWAAIVLADCRYTFKCGPASIPLGH